MESRVRVALRGGFDALGDIRKPSLFGGNPLAYVAD